MRKQIKYIIECSVCRKQEENIPSRISFNEKNICFDNTYFLFYENKEFCSKICLRQFLINEEVKPLKIKEIIKNINSPKEKKLIEKKEAEERLAVLKKEWEEEEKNRKPVWERLRIGKNEFQLRLLPGCHIGKGMIAYGMYGEPDKFMKVCDYEDMPPLTPEEWYFDPQQPERKVSLEIAREKDIFSQKGKLL